MRRTLVAALAAVAVALAALPALAEPLKVVTSFSILGDMVRQIGGDAVAVTTLVGADGDAHVYEPTPADARAVAAADVVVVNGLGFEGWMGRLVKAAGYKGPVVFATRGIKPIKGDHDHGHDHGEDPHAWQSVGNARIYADNIVAGLVDAAPAMADGLRAGHAAYTSELNALDRDIKAALAPVPKVDRRIVTSHDAFGYYARAYGVTFLAPVGISTEAEPSAGDVARLIRQMKKEKARAVFVESIADPRLLEQIARETGARIGGRVYSDALSGPEGPAPSYVAMMRHNTRLFVEALKPGS
ncbi:zinc ABC transporter solute-binding protein [Azospirillum sp. RWY-5-1]|uniref:Zinc ABC transporter solute-binding protein n=1 Tax=Azospirillum oleiclasticum TaxID=2735135 RepID=A0ABX2TEV3_9PROT|nr:zinc ABC transporter substrate-binding protein [Azospirillum oleiclasticum]NYZ15114.1 zinc ABC transporter solute-binding protein [Azospirillum oleiclasticum]NYZ22877.1 zinc ABC transporter solute-binding protein [Azospirillum oleiclasticum]